LSSGYISRVEMLSIVEDVAVRDLSLRFYGWVFSCVEFRFLGAGRICCLEDKICCRVDTFNPRLVVIDWDLKWVHIVGS